jgi:hypothetical protein
MDIRNQRFADLLDAPGGKEKIAQLASNYIRDRLREDSYTAQVIPPQDVTPAECQKSLTHDGLMKVVEVEPTSDAAMPVTFRGGTYAQFIRAPRVGVPFYSIMSPMFEKVEQELLAYDMPLTKIIEKNAVKDLEAIQDHVFTVHIESAVQAMQTAANGGSSTELSGSTVQAGTVVERSAVKGESARNATTDDTTVRPIQRVDFPRLVKTINAYEKKPASLLMTEPDYTDLIQWTIQELGHDLTSSSVEKGLPLNTLFGYKFIRTIKTRILRQGNVYCFTEPDFLGVFYVLNKVKFYLDKKVNKIMFCAWEDIGMCIVNVSSIGKLELYSEDANPSTQGTPSILAALTPVPYESLNDPYHRVEEGDVYPYITQY